MIQITDIGGDKREFYRPVRLCNTQHALKGQKLLAQGSALGIMAIVGSGRQVCDPQKTRALPWAKRFCPLQGVLIVFIIAKDVKV